MRFRPVFGALQLAVLEAVLCVALLPSLANAEETAGAQVPAAPTLHRDPKGQKGLTPFWEAVKRGDDAVSTNHLDTARNAFDDAIEKEPDNPLGHYRLGQAEAIKGNLKEAESAYQNAVRLAADKPVIRAKAMFALADLQERKRAFAEALAAWTAYENYAKINRAPGMFPPAAFERKRRIQASADLAREYAVVKDRIKTRLEEAEKKAAESARSPANR
jgi:tetratricopeptide (TPR) repeat protein